MKYEYEKVFFISHLYYPKAPYYSTEIQTACHQQPEVAGVLTPV